MNYQRHYDLLIARAQNRVTLEGYVERHHIIPRCMGGGNDADNIATLTASEHFVAHQLLVKMYPKVRKLIFALGLMCASTTGRTNNKFYSWLRSRHSLAHHGRVMSEETKAKLREVRKLQICSDETRAKLSAAGKGRIVSNETRAKIRATLMGRPRYDLRGRPQSPEQRAKRSAAMMGHSTSPETRAKMSAAQKGKTQSVATRAKKAASMERNTALRNGSWFDDHPALLTRKDNA